MTQSPPIDEPTKWELPGPCQHKVYEAGKVGAPLVTLEADCCPWCLKKELASLRGELEIVRDNYMEKLRGCVALNKQLAEKEAEIARLYAKIAELEAGESRRSIALAKIVQEKEASLSHHQESVRGLAAVAQEFLESHHDDRDYYEKQKTLSEALALYHQTQGKP